jgi:hypothetical protein
MARSISSNSIVLDVNLTDETPPLVMTASQRASRR